MRGRAIRDQCVAADVPFFFKQSAARWTEVGTQLVEADGRKATWQQFPEVLPPGAGAAGRRRARSARSQQPPTLDLFRQR